MWLELTLGPSFKVKRWLIGFGELSLWWIQFASALRCVRSSLYLVLEVCNVKNASKKPHWVRRMLVTCELGMYLYSRMG